MQDKHISTLRAVAAAVPVTAVIVTVVMCVSAVTSATLFNDTRVGVVFAMAVFGFVFTASRMACEHGASSPPGSKRGHFDGGAGSSFEWSAGYGSHANHGGVSHGGHGVHDSGTDSGGGDSGGGDGGGGDGGGD